MLDKSKQIRVKMRVVLNHFPAQARGYTVKDTLWWLKKLNVDNDYISVPALCRVGVDLSDMKTYRRHLRRIWELKGELIIGCSAIYVYAYWMGGPPLGRQRFRGNFLQLLMDRILTDINVNGIENFIRILKEFKTTQAVPKEIPQKMLTNSQYSSVSGFGTDGSSPEWSILNVIGCDK